MDDPTALFHQYEQDYCNKSTEISRKISALTGVSTGETLEPCRMRWTRASILVSVDKAAWSLETLFLVICQNHAEARRPRSRRTCGRPTVW